MNTRAPRKYLLDWETRSVCDLLRRGAHVYAKDPTTRVLCGSWINLDDRSERGCIVVDHVGHYTSSNVPAWMQDPDVEVWAWNAAFEQQIWNEVASGQLGIPRLDPGRFKCLMKFAAHAGMPLALDRACVAAGLSVSKDMVGHRLMLKWCKPLPLTKVEKSERSPAPRWADDVAEYKNLCAYADTDRDVEVMMYERLVGSVSEFELAIMDIDREINDSGFRIDVDAVAGAASIASEEIKRLNKDMSRLTNGVITTCNQRERILNFASERGIELDNLRSATVRDTLAGEEDTGAEQDLLRADMPPLIREILELRVEANKASVAKLNAMVRGVGEDGYFRGGFAYGGASKTLRWAGRRTQIQNYPRDNPPDGVDETLWFDALATGDREYFAEFLPEGWTVMDGLKASLRGMIVA